MISNFDIDGPVMIRAPSAVTCSVDRTATSAPGAAVLAADRRSSAIRDAGPDETGIDPHPGVGRMVTGAPLFTGALDLACCPDRLAHPVRTAHTTSAVTIDRGYI
ncbi:MAG: hypothetical protein DLM57_12595 [Pseudonocardiales bacterium]|nr:MAG: hypothetical protein DLM57_12595 [Pseudonocardiales bacterium]